LINKISS